MKPILFLALTLALAATSSQAATLTTTNDGVKVDAGAFGQFTLNYPSLDVGKGDPLKPIEKTPAGNKAVLKYAGNAQVDVSIDPDGTITYTFSNPPAGLKNYRMDMLIDFSFREGGTWRVGGGAATAFPQDKPAQPHLYQGNAATFTLANAEGKILALDIPPYSYEEVNDNREWGWKIFNWMFIAPFDQNNPRGIVKVHLDTAGAKRVIVADRFGQDATMDFPGKVKTEADLKGDIARDEAYYGSLKAPERDTYG
ncbi:MAG: hypothetical protein M3Y56_16550, partial [Armatimonadota bacterium]|nr:hypothetical protein [Armatimonadota bacterium]